MDTMLRALRSEDASPALRVKVEELRNKRDSLETKAEALKRHRLRGWANAQREFEEARSELKTTWRTVIGRLDRESLFI